MLASEETKYLFISQVKSKNCFPFQQDASQEAAVVKNTPANAGAAGDTDLIPGSGRSPGEGHGTPLQYSCLENPMDREAWWATVHRVAKSWT